MRLCPNSNANFGPERIGRFKVQNSGCPEIPSGKNCVPSKALRKLSHLNFDSRLPKKFDNHIFKNIINY